MQRVKHLRAALGVITIAVLVLVALGITAPAPVANAEPPARPLSDVGPIGCADKHVSNSLISAYAYATCNGGNPSINVAFNYMDNVYYIGSTIDAVSVEYDLTPQSGDLPQTYEIYGNADGSSTYSLCATHTNSSGTNSVGLSCGANIAYLYFHQTGAPRWSRIENVIIRTAAPTNTPTPTNTAAPTATYEPGSACDDLGVTNYLCNGSFEFPYGNPHDWTYNRAATVHESQIAKGYPGAAYCGKKFVNINGEGITQRVFLPAGPLYFSFVIRKAVQDGGHANAQVEIVSATSPDIGLNWIVLDGKRDTITSRIVGDTWYREEHSHTFLTPTTGWYDVKFYNVQEAVAGLNPLITSTPVPIGDPPAWDYQYDKHYDYQVDDIVLSSIGYRTYCTNSGATTTPQASPTIRGTSTRTPTPGGPTHTPAPVGNFQNCDFEAGLSGWQTIGNVNVQLAGGPVGPQFARVQGSSSNLSQVFQWGGGQAFFTFWIGPGSGGSVRVQRASGFGVAYEKTLWSQSETSPGWKLIRATISSLPSGTYKLVFQGNQFNNLDIDGVMPGYNDYRYCGNNNGATPTAGPTSFVTATPTRTPTSGPSPTPRPATATRTPGPTNTPNATWTPSTTPSGFEGTGTALAGTQTQVAASATALASITPSPTPTTPPTNTPANDATATALASVTPATSTGTPAASTTPIPPPSTPTVMPNPNPQPEPAPGADCQRPDNPFNLAGWMEFEVCQVLTWFVWTGENSQQVLNIQATLSVYEPIGTLNELADARDTVADEVNDFDWANTGLQSGELPNLNIFIPSTTPNGLLTGSFTLGAGPNATNFYFLRTCGLDIADVFGQAMSQGMCAAINWLLVTGILNWVQYFFDLAVWIAFMRYAWYTVTQVVPTML